MAKLMCPSPEREVSESGSGKPLGGSGLVESARGVGGSTEETKATAHLGQAVQRQVSGVFGAEAARRQK